MANNAPELLVVVITAGLHWLQLALVASKACYTFSVAWTRSPSASNDGNDEERQGATPHLKIPYWFSMCFATSLGLLFSILHGCLVVLHFISEVYAKVSILQV